MPSGSPQHPVLSRHRGRCLVTAGQPTGKEEGGSREGVRLKLSSNLLSLPVPPRVWGLSFFWVGVLEVTN